MALFNTMKIKYDHKYLFEAEFVDGFIYKQNPEDHSRIFPPKMDAEGEMQGKSCMTDVFHYIEEGKTLRRFSLVGDGNRITVDLGNGIFYINKLPVLLESEQLPCLPDKFNIVYYKQVDQSMNVDVNQQEGTLNEGSINTYVEYFIGWECKIGAKNYQQKIAVS